MEKTDTAPVVRLTEESEDAGRLTSVREAEIRAREQLATCGPWVYLRDMAGYWITCAAGLKAFRLIRCCQHKFTVEETAANGRFVANARQDIPLLLAELTALRRDFKSKSGALGVCADLNNKLIAQTEDLQREIAEAQKQRSLAISWLLSGKPSCYHCDRVDDEFLGDCYTTDCRRDVAGALCREVKKHKTVEQELAEVRQELTAIKAVVNREQLTRLMGRFIGKPALGVAVENLLANLNGLVKLELAEAASDAGEGE
jgi:hypothetical protein